MTTKKPKYYAIKVGRKTGIVRSWEECLEATKGYSGAVYKKFESEQAAADWLEGRDSQGGQKARTVSDFQADYEVYTDGSFIDGRYSWAYVFVKDGEIIYEDSNVGKNSEAVTMRNVAGEIAAVLYAVKKAASLGARILIHHDYAGIAHWVKGEWKTNNEFTKLYAKLMLEHHGLYDFVKVPAHSGNKFNEYVDQKAKEALGIIKGESFDEHPNIRI